ncbi:hypothetical protein LX32DRAFT_322426 [Colletotrichum zoysiae]|uniref:Uncharacterized protein n=1 Tax=Colletotrichum zoysiae TaxID=1216348 RepID=A0AAD9M3H4_9PEZI|nr:hypothetical protein LX32DRAFT_322426 [Colletotrichum zoysiae]
MASSHSHLRMVCGVVGWLPAAPWSRPNTSRHHLRNAVAGGGRQCWSIAFPPPSSGAAKLIILGGRMGGGWPVVPTPPPKRCSPLSAAFSFSPPTPPWPRNLFDDRAHLVFFSRARGRPREWKAVDNSAGAPSNFDALPFLVGQPGQTRA